MNVTYWFGAGASAQALPVISNFEEHIAKSRKDLYEVFFNKWININHALYSGDEIARKLIEGCYTPLLQYVKDSEKFTTIDTLSKYYLVSDVDKFNYYKRILKAFFLIEDYVINRIDGRYLGLIASISKNNIVDKGINFITWNYDNQLYKAKRVFGDIPFVIPNWDSPNEPISDNNSIVYHLNGSSHDIDVFSQPYHFGSVPDKMEFILERIYSILDNKESTQIRYAFEESVNYELLLNDLKKKLKDTEVLVVTGYSFPYFNRFIDKIILDSCINLHKIYIQDMSPEPVIERLQQLSKGLWEERDGDPFNISNVIHPNPNIINGTVTYEIVNNLNAFHIPVELD